MANYCDFFMRITGREEAIKELIAMLTYQGKFKEDGLGYIFDFDCENLEETSVPGIFSVDGYGDCAWSIKSSMREAYREHSLESETERLGLVVEAYSSEPGNKFQEHVLIVKGEVVLDDCVEYEEHLIDAYPSLEEYNKDHDTNFTPDMVNEDGEVCIGGFGDVYGVFEEVSHYFVEEKTVPEQGEIGIKVYFDGVHVDTVWVPEKELDVTINSIAKLGFDNYNGAVKEDWEKLSSSHHKPTLSFEVMVFEHFKEKDKVSLSEQIESAREQVKTVKVENTNKEVVRNIILQPVNE